MIMYRMGVGSGCLVPIAVRLVGLLSTGLHIARMGHAARQGSGVFLVLCSAD